MTTDYQAKCLLYYLREIRTMLNVTRVFSLQDFLEGTPRPLLAHVADVYACIVRDQQISQTLKSDWTVTPEDLERLSLEAVDVKESDENLQIDVEKLRKENAIL